MSRRTKLVCTIGPATDDRIGELVAAGMDVARVNLSHGTADDHRRRVEAVAAAREAQARPVATLADLPGPKVRLGPFRDGSAELMAGRRFTFRGSGPDGDATSVTTDHAGLVEDLRPGDRILLADGVAELRVAAVGSDVVTDVVRGGVVRSRQGVNVPSERLSLPAVTDRDRASLPLALEAGVDFVAQSFVRSADDILELRALMGSRPVPIVAKIETRSAVEHLDAILEAADAIMVARGDLGVEIPFEEVPLVQKAIVRRALERGTPTIVATQMLESMVGAPRPTRAEASDVANAVLDGADAVMLSAETAVGRFPVEAAAAAVRICLAAESDRPASAPSGAIVVPTSPDRAIALAAVSLARTERAFAGIACFTRTGRTAELLASLRPDVPIFAFAPAQDVRRRLQLRSAVVPIGIEPELEGEGIIRAMTERLLGGGLVEEGAMLLAARTSAGSDGLDVLEVVRLDASTRGTGATISVSQSIEEERWRS